MKTLDRHIEDVMDWFDFNKVKTVMNSLNWKWATDDGGMAVPEIVEMRKNVRKYMRELYAKFKNEKEVSAFTGSGGFMVYYDKSEDENGPWDRFNVVFELTSWDTEC
jgi:hypothetical protein